MGIQRDGAVGEDGEAVIVYSGTAPPVQETSRGVYLGLGVHAPVVFFCQNNQWPSPSRWSGKSRIPLYQWASGFGFRACGWTATTCWPASRYRKAMQAAREGQGPTLIEAFTYRMGAQHTTDDPSRYRLASELEAWKLRTPSSGQGVLGPHRRGRRRVLRRRWTPRPTSSGPGPQACLEMPTAAAGHLRERLRRPNTLLDAEREQYAAYLNSFAGGGPMTS